MLSKSSKLELSLIHYIAKFTISRLVISRFECNMLSKSSKLELGFVHYIAKFSISRFECIYKIEILFPSKGVIF